MRLLILIALNLHIKYVYSKRYVSSSEEESIENLLYYQDCSHKHRETTMAPVKLRMSPTPTPNDCPFPKMCCMMSCGNECGAHQSVLGRQIEPLRNVQQPIQQLPPTPRPVPIPPVQPEILPRGRKRVKPGSDILNIPIGSRRDLGFTKEKIKTLISQDDDIRKILKDLVRVTMQKVDLLEKINSRKATEHYSDYWEDGINPLH